MITIQTHDFNQGDEYRGLATGSETGAVVTFVGRVRDFAEDAENALFLEHYPGMTESVLRNIVKQANVRWQLHQVRIIHRVGHLHSGDQIVFIGVSSRHRKDAFAACEYIMDFLKTEAPFWKREGEQWVEAKQSDTEAARQWHD